MCQRLGGDVSSETLSPLVGNKGDKYIELLVAEARYILRGWGLLLSARGGAYYYLCLAQYIEGKEDIEAQTFFAVVSFGPKTPLPPQKSLHNPYFPQHLSSLCVACEYEIHAELAYRA